MRTVIGIYLLLSSIQALACDCIVYSDPKTYLSEVDMVFTGKVVELIKVESELIEVPKFFDTIPGGKEQYKAMYPDQFYAKVIMTENIKGDTLKVDTLLFTSEFTNCDPI